MLPENSSERQRSDAALMTYKTNSAKVHPADITGDCSDPKRPTVSQNDDKRKQSPGEGLEDSLSGHRFLQPPYDAAADYLSQNSSTTENSERQEGAMLRLPTTEELQQMLRRKRRVTGQSILRKRSSQEDFTLITLDDNRASVSTVPSHVSFNPNVSIHSSTPPQPIEYRRLRRRWYILALFSAFACGQVCVWNTFGPISSSAMHVFGFENDVIALLNCMGPIAYLISGVFYCWLLNTIGLVALGTMIRCFASEDFHIARWLMIAGHFLNGLGGPVAASGAPKLSANWFPTGQRATATTIGTVAFYLGLAMSFVIGPYFMPAETEKIDSPAIRAGASVKSNNITSASWSRHRQAEFGGIQLLLYMESAWTVSVFGLMLIYFPSRPYMPPSASSEEDREDFRRGLVHILWNKELWLLAFSYALSVGIVTYWSSLLSVILQRNSISQDESGWIGFYAVVTSMIFSLILARYVDKYLLCMKGVVVLLLMTGSVVFILITLASNHVIPPTVGLFYVLLIIGMTCVDSTVPIVFELSCEHAFPIGEGMITLFLTYVNNALGVVFLLSRALGILDVWLLNGILVISLPLSFIMLMAVDQRFLRRDMDLGGR